METRKKFSDIIREEKGEFSVEATIICIYIIIITMTIITSVIKIYDNVCVNRQKEIGRNAVELNITAENNSVYK